MQKLSKKELAARWDCSTRTVERDVKRFGLIPCDFTGRQPVFEETAVARMEERRRLHKLETNGHGPAGIVTVKTAKKLAGKRGSR